MMTPRFRLQPIRMPELDFIGAWREEIAQGLQLGALAPCFEKRVTLRTAQMTPEDYVEYRKAHNGKPREVLG